MMPDGSHDDPPEQAPTVLLAATPDRRRVEGWLLVLLSLGMHPLITRVQGGFALYVRGNEAAKARAELEATEAEEAEARRDRVADTALDEEPATRHAVAGAVALAVALMAFYAVTGPNRAGAVWFSAGASDADRVLHGEWWRAITALTLHADLAHVVSNAGIGVIVVAAVMRAIGVGWGAALVVAAGVAGNIATAWMYQGHHLSVGFSTAVFGAIGILGGLATMRTRRRELGPRATWTGLGAALALLGVLGTSAETDVLAHLLGGVAGVALGLVAGWSQWRPRSWAGQTLTGLAVLVVLVGAWWVAKA
ncbi:MAG: Rhomboid family protein [Cyanobacteria bacterium RYN_339]|nr:Rhomboid family protein [Cyanobacteria bacterium RYN_339]